MPATTKEPAILFVKPGDIEDGEIAILQAAGVLVARVKNPAAIKFTRAKFEISGNTLLTEAMRIINTHGCDSVRNAFSKAVEAHINAAHGKQE